MATYRRLEDLVVYQKFCRLHIEVSELSHRWPPEEKYELGSQIRRSSNSAPAQLEEYRSRYQECIRMLNGMERALETHLPESDRRWRNEVKEGSEAYGDSPCGFPDP